ncbi:hypothetical protein [Vibrio splendidus]|uniref:hypothetical protein n=1 Tax=Vibrio splendidus TaxID=29497 RepID=UPI003D09FAEE
MKISIVCKNDLAHLAEMSHPEQLKPHVRQEKAAQVILAQVRESKSFLLCHCVNPPAKMFVRYAYSSFHIVNHAVEGIHSQCCPMHTDVKGSIDHTDRDSSKEERVSFRLHEKLSMGPKTSSTADTRLPNEGSKTTSVRESKLNQLFNLLCKTTLANWHFPNKANSPNQALMKFRIAAEKVTFGKTTLNNYIFFGHKGFKYAVGKLKSDISHNKWKGPGRPQALVFFITKSFTLNGNLIKIDEVNYQFNHQSFLAHEAGGPYFIALTVCQNEIGSIRPHSLFIRPICSETHVSPVDSSEERHFISTAIEHINSVQDKWSIQRAIFSKSTIDTSLCMLPNYVIQQKNADNKVKYRAVINLAPDSNLIGIKPKHEPVPLDIWRANARISINLNDQDLGLDAIFR